MENTNWLRQTKDKPLFPDILWSRPENKAQAGKLLIIGGNQHAFSNVARTYSETQSAGIGSVRTIMPDRLKKSIGKIFPEAEFAPSTLSGSFSKQALAMLLDEANWADGVLLAGDFGRNSETAILLESFADKYQGLLTLFGDSIDYFIKHPEQITDREERVIICDFGQAQKLLAGQTLLKHDMDLSKIVESLGEFSKAHQATVVVNHDGYIVVACKGKVSTTKNGSFSAAFFAVLILQNSNKVFEAATTAASLL